MARLRKIERDELPAESREILDDLEKGLGRVPNLFRV